MQAQELAALARIRQDFESSTPAEQWPEAAAAPMMLLADVVYALGGDDEAARQVLGPAVFAYLLDLTGGQHDAT